MNKIINALIVLCFVFSVSACYADGINNGYVYVTSNDKVTLYLDTSSVQTTNCINDNTNINVYNNDDNDTTTNNQYSNNQYSNNGMQNRFITATFKYVFRNDFQNNNSNVHYRMVQEQYDCQQHTSRVMSSSDYDQNGNQVNYFSNNNGWQQINQGSVNDQQFHFVLKYLRSQQSNDYQNNYQNSNHHHHHHDGINLTL